MTPDVQILEGDCLEQLRTLPDESVHCCVTSPPYWGLRDYGVAGQLGLEKTPEEYVAKMVEVFREVRRVLREDGTVWMNLGSSYANSGKGRGGSYERDGMTTSQSVYSGGKRPSQSRSCAPACGIGGKEPQGSMETDSACSDLCDECRAALSRRSGCTGRQPKQSPLRNERIGHDSVRPDFAGEVPAALLPPAPASTMPQFSQQLQEGCRHCANCGACLSVLRSLSRDASLCVRKERRNSDTSSLGSEHRNQDKDALVTAYPYLSTQCLNFKPKDLIPIPWMVAMALQQDGWFLRCDVIWSKPNPMPESVTDRPTKAHEYIFLLAKRERYFYDAEAVKEACESGPSDIRKMEESLPRIGGKHKTLVDPLSKASCATNIGQKRSVGDPAGRNKRSVWTVATSPYSEAHFATFPPDLIKPCILAGTSARGCCPKCGVQWGRVVNRETHKISDSPRYSGNGDRNDSEDGRSATTTTTTGWQPTCDCYDPDVFPEASKPHPCTVLDPFAGSGTTGQVALELGRSAILIELNPKYVELIRKRTHVTPGMAL